MNVKGSTLFQLLGGYNAFGDRDLLDLLFGESVITTGAGAGDRRPTIVMSGCSCFLSPDNFCSKSSLTGLVGWLLRRDDDVREMVTAGRAWTMAFGATVFFSIEGTGLMEIVPERWPAPPIVNLRLCRSFLIGSFEPESGTVAFAVVALMSEHGEAVDGVRIIG